MALLERVSTLVRANLNDLIDKAEDPEKMIKQVILDMQNQLLQVKTQVAIAIADQHVLEKKYQENEEKTADWVRKAEMAVDKKQDDLARVALERSVSYRQHVRELQTAGGRPEAAGGQSQSGSTEAGSETGGSAGQEGCADCAAPPGAGRQQGQRRAVRHQQLIRPRPPSTAMKDKVRHSEAVSQAKAELFKDDVEEQLAALDKQDQIEKMLADMKAKRG